MCRFKKKQKAAAEKAAAAALAAGPVAGPSAEGEGDELDVDPQAEDPPAEHQQEEEEDATPMAPPAKRRLHVSLFSHRPKVTATATTTKVSVAFRKAIMLILGIFKNINLKLTYHKYCTPCISTAKIHPQNIQMNGLILQKGKGRGKGRQPTSTKAARTVAAPAPQTPPIPQTPPAQQTPPTEQTPPPTQQLHQTPAPQRSHAVSLNVNVNFNRCIQ